MPDALSEALALPGLGWMLLTVIVAGLVRGFSGFGSAMIIMPVASTVFTPVGAIIFLTTVELFGPLPNLRSALHNGTRPDVARLALGAVFAMPLGVFALAHMSPQIFSWAVSVVVLGLLVVLMLGWRYHGSLTPPMVLGTGALGGFLSGSIGVAGPPVIMLYMASTLPISAIRANFLLYLLMIDGLMLGLFWVLGLFQLEPAIAGLVLTVPYMMANRMGAALFNPQSERVFRAVAYSIIAASALLGLPVWS